MPRIDPFQLLKCLSVLLGPSGGIKSREEVHRLANLMTKFSKKLVSKCIYIQILKTTNTELLSQFMDAGGWSLVHMWLTDGIVAKNWALIQELLELLHLCPVKIERLKSNNCPKLIKGLSKEVSHQGVRLLASRLVEQWLKIVKGEAAPNSVPAQIIGSSSALCPSTTAQSESFTIAEAPNSADTEDETTTVKVQDLEPTTNNYTIETNPPSSQPMQLHILNQPATTTSPSPQVQHITKQSYVVVGNGTSVIPTGPVCKITIRDGKHVLVKVETDAANINNAMNSPHEMNGEAAEVETTPEEQNDGDYEEMTVERLDDEEDYEAAAGNAEESASETKEIAGGKGIETAEVSTRSKDPKDKENNVATSGDAAKSNDKENRDSHKTDEKKATVSTEKKSSGGSSRSSGSSKHSSSSSSHRASSHRSSHRSSSSSSRGSSSKDKSSRDRHHHSSSSRHGSSSSSSSSSSKNKTERDKEREKEKEKLKRDQADKDKATLEKVQAQAISSKLGKIPRKKPDDEKPPGDALLRKSSTDSKDSSKENKDKSETRKSFGGAANTTAAVLEKKNISISIENRKNSLDSTRPKTVKTFNSKFRSTGLEEEVKPPPPRNATKKLTGNAIDKKIVPPKPLTALKRTSPLRETTAPSDKRLKLSLDPPAEPIEEKKGAIKLISPKPKPMVLQESDMFMDALMTASTKSKEPRKRNKRRPSISKDAPSDAKKSDLGNSDGGHDSPAQQLSPHGAGDRSPVALKPNFKFYQDTLETDEDKEEQPSKKSNKEEDTEEMKLDADGNEDYETSVSNLVKTEMAALAVKAEAKEVERDDAEVTKTLESPDREDTNAESDTQRYDKNDRSVSPQPEIRYVDGLRSVLLLQKRKGPKKSLKWKTDLESIRYFELDETERVNVTKTFTDMKQMEKQGEREAFQMARKLSTEDLMEEKTTWTALIPIDLQAPLVEPGKDSREKEIQYAREKGILQALYFNRSMIPDSPAEPDEERHHTMTDPKVIPLEDLTGNKDSEKDFTGVPWPDPKPSLPSPAPVIQAPGGYMFPPGYPHSQPPMMPPMGPPGPMGPMAQMPPGPMMGPMNHMGPPDMSGGPMGAGPMGAGGGAGVAGGGGGGGWRTGDGKVVVPDVAMNPMQQPMPNMPGGYPPGMDGPMGPPGMMGPPMFNQQEGYGMMGPDDMGYGNFQGPPGPPGMYGPGPNFPGGPPRGGGPMHGNRGRGSGPGWFRGGGVAGGPPIGPRMGGGGGWRGGWRGNGKQPPICRQFTKSGYCRVGDKCQYLHPGVNCPPF